MFSTLLAFTILFASCTLTSQQSVSQQNSLITDSNKSVIQNETELERNERIWRESNVTNYKMTVESAIADALYTTLSPVEIEVRDSKAVSIKHLAKDGKPVPIEDVKNNYGLMLYERRGFDTVEGMFRLIKRAEEGKTGKGFKTTLLKVEYDPKLGYPTKIEFDVAATDSYVSLRVKKFEIIE